MSKFIAVFVDDINDSIIPRWLEELNKLGMKCEIYPEFSFEQPSEFVQFKINVEPPHLPYLNSRYLTGFDFEVEDYQLKQHFQASTKQSWLDKALRKPIKMQYFVSEEIDARLQQCKMLTFSWGENIDTFSPGSGVDSFGYRMALLASATLAKLSKGILWETQLDEWYCDDMAAVFLSKVISHEKAIKQSDFRAYLFEEWLTAE